MVRHTNATNSPPQACLWTPLPEYRWTLAQDKAASLLYCWAFSQGEGNQSNPVSTYQGQRCHFSLLYMWWCWTIFSKLMSGQHTTLTDRSHTECPRGNVPDFRRMFLKLKYTDITKNTYTRSWTVTEIMAREKCGLLAVPLTVPGSRDVLPVHCACPSFSL